MLIGCGNLELNQVNIAVSMIKGSKECSYLLHLRYHSFQLVLLVDEVPSDYFQLNLWRH